LVSVASLLTIVGIGLFLFLARKAHAKKASADQQTKELSNPIGMTFIPIHPGGFLMGNKVKHQVTITYSFYMGKELVTIGQWRAVMKTTNCKFTGDDHQPVSGISYCDAQAFIDNLNSLDSKHLYRLPTEAEFEYVCQIQTSNNGTNKLSGKETMESNHFDLTAIGQQPQINDLICNVSQWCQDWYEDYPTNAVIDPYGPHMGESRCYQESLKVLRGKETPASPVDITYRTCRTLDICHGGIRVVVVDKSPENIKRYNMAHVPYYGGKCRELLGESGNDLLCIVKQIGNSICDPSPNGIIKSIVVSKIGAKYYGDIFDRNMMSFDSYKAHGYWISSGATPHEVNSNRSIIALSLDGKHLQGAILYNGEKIVMFQERSEAIPEIDYEIREMIQSCNVDKNNILIASVK